MGEKYITGPQQVPRWPQKSSSYCPMSGSGHHAIVLDLGIFGEKQGQKEAIKKKKLVEHWANRQESLKVRTLIWISCFYNPFCN